MSDFIRRIRSDDEGQDIAEYAVMLAVIQVIVVGTIRLIGAHSNTVFSNVAIAVAQSRDYFQAGLRPPGDSCSVTSELDVCAGRANSLKFSSRGGPGRCGTQHFPGPFCF